MSQDPRGPIRARLARERGTIRREASCRVALVYPSPYHVAMSSLGYQTIYGIANAVDGVAADRAMAPDDDDAPGPLLTLERETPIEDYPAILFSVAYELEVGGLVRCLDRAGVPALTSERDASHPIIIAGGPLTFSNPVPLAPFCDVILLGEGETLVARALELIAGGGARDAIVDALAREPGVYVPRLHGEDLPPIAQVDDDLLPARSVIATPDTELADMFLTEAARGCSRGCTYCVMRRSTNGGMRVVPVAKILAGVPADARRVGLVGAAVTDHPQIVDVVAGVVEAGRGVGISSLRADRLTDDLVRLLAKGGYRTLTVASDGPSERLRAFIERKTYERHLVEAARLARAHGLATLKTYMMVGLPGETDEDLDELVRFSLELAKIHPRIALGVAPFVAKRRTPLDGEPFAGITEVEHKLERVRRGLKGRAEVRPTSARWAWVEYMLAQGGVAAGLAAMDAARAGGTFAAYKKAFAARGATPTGPRLRVPTTREQAAAKKLLPLAG